MKFKDFRERKTHIRMEKLRETKSTRKNNSTTKFNKMERKIKSEEKKLKIEIIS